MKQKSIYNAALAALMLIPAGCSDEQYDNSTQPGNEASGPLITVTATQGARPQTRLGYNDPSDPDAPNRPIEVAWAESDTLYVGKDFSGFNNTPPIDLSKTNSYFSPFILNDGDANSKIGNFTGNLPSEVADGATIYGIYGEGKRIKMDKKEPGILSFDYTNQVQTGNGWNYHLWKADFMLATTSYIPEETPIFNFTHLGAIIKFEITIPTEEMWVKQLSITTTDGTKPFISTAQWQKDGEFAFSAIKMASPSTTLMMRGEGDDKMFVHNRKLIAYMMVAPTTLTNVEMNNKELLLKLTDENGVVYGTPIKGVNIEQGKYYTVKVPALKPIVNDMTFIIKTRRNNGSTGIPTYVLPFNPGETIPHDIIVDWGDGKEVELIPSGTIWTENSFEHAYSEYSIGKEYTIIISSSQTDPTRQQIPKLYFNENLYKIVTPLLNTGNDNFDRTFSYCENLETVPPGLLDNNPQAKSFFGCFDSCKKLTSLPAGLFDKNTQARIFEDCFSSCSSLTELPAGLFDKNTQATNFKGCFFGCVKLEKLSEGFFNNNKQVTNFQSCFSGCSVLFLNETIFSLTKDHNIFKDRDMNFNECFNGTGYNLEYNDSGKAPRLWEYNLSIKTVFMDCYKNCKASNFDGLNNVYWGTPIKK